MRISDWSSDVCSSDLLSGMTAAYEFSRRAGPGRTCLLLENHPIVGGEAKQNEFLVEGRRLTAPQGSNGALLLKDGYVKGSYGGELYRSEEHTSELQSLMRISYAVFCLKKKKNKTI